jgi:hypothetical protein
MKGVEDRTWQNRVVEADLESDKYKLSIEAKVEAVWV